MSYFNFYETFLKKFDSALLDCYRYFYMLFNISFSNENDWMILLKEH